MKGTNEEIKDQNAKIREAIEEILIESGLSISAFSRKVGYSRQYIYELLKPKGEGFARKIQLDTLKRICDATGYSLTRLLSDIGYISKPQNDAQPHTVIIVKKGGERAVYSLDERNATLIEGLSSALKKREKTDR